MMYQEAVFRGPLFGPLSPLSVDIDLIDLPVGAAARVARLCRRDTRRHEVEGGPPTMVSHSSAPGPELSVAAA